MGAETSEVDGAPRVIVATKNAGKVAELREMFARRGWTLDTYDAYADPDEGERSYAENAALKARALRAQLLAAGRPGAVVGDDSGLEVDALGGRPGIASARYGPPGATWDERRALLLAEVGDAKERSRGARFVCALHFIAVAGGEIAVEAACAGTIAEREAGGGGFSYDALFRPAGSSATFAEIAAAEKNATSHRARAVDALFARLEHLPEDGSRSENSSGAGT